ncbi:MAG: MarR family transcriptional regulator [Clostridiales bacterium]|nr:MarR family transcriptional regulator [Clostridiales bacterium]
MIPSFFARSKSLSKLYHQLFKPLLERYDITQLEADILMFLANNPSQDTARDIVEKRHLSKSHVSVGVDNLVRRGYLERSCHNGNRKTIYLNLLPPADEVVAAGRDIQHQYAQCLLRGFGKEEISYLAEMLDRIADNVELALSPSKERK